MKQIHISVNDKIATGDGTKIVCGNTDYIVVFAFDEEWQEHDVKTLRVRYGGTYEEVVFRGETAQLPRLQNTLGVEIGVYAGDLETTTPAFFDCLKSILCGSEVHEPPAEDVYNQIIKLVEGAAALPAGGTTGQVLTKQSDEDGDATWQDHQGGGGGATIELGHGLMYDEDGKLAVNVVNAAEVDNTLPITSAAVATTVGNIEVLLKTI